jgi:hypothetical protein
MTTSSSPDEWVLAAPRSALPALQPLVDAHAARRPVRLLLRGTPEVPPLEEIAGELESASGALIVGDRRRSPRSVLPGPFLSTPTGRKVPAGWLPLSDSSSVKRFAAAAAEVQCRTGAAGPFAFLGQWDSQVVRMMGRSLNILRGSDDQPQIPVFWWTADRIVRRDLLCALQIGLGAAIYFGHGRPYGWAGYHGLHTRHLEYAQGRPAGAVLSLTCHTASRRRVGTSFAESIVLGGIAAAAFGAVSATQTVDNWWWGASVCEAMTAQASTLGDLLLRACPPRPAAVTHYRILGDPLARLLGAPGACEKAAQIWAPAAHDSPVPPGYEERLASLATT